MKGPRTKPLSLVALPSATRTATAHSDVLKAETEEAVLVTLVVTSASGTGGLRVRINGTYPMSHVPAGQEPPRFPLNVAPDWITTTGGYSYSLFPFGAVDNESLAQSTRGYLPLFWSISVEHGDASAYTYSVSYSLLQVRVRDEE